VDAGEADVVAALDAHFAEETRRGQTVVGPHRDDLLIEVDGRDLRLYGSRGQQRLMALTLRLAEAGPVARAVGSAPVLLLDDALSELDPQVEARVLEHVAAAGQVFLTTADAALPAARRVTWWEVRAGCVTDPTLSAVRGVA
jgi:DNA replication and repair protein RecF